MDVDLLHVISGWGGERRGNPASASFTVHAGRIGGWSGWTFGPGFAYHDVQRMGNPKGRRKTTVSKKPATKLNKGKKIQKTLALRADGSGGGNSR